MTDVDNDTLVKAAQEALTRPSDFGYFGDLPLFESWGFVSGQSAASDTLERSNYRSALRQLIERATSADGDQAGDANDYVQEVHVSDWLVGSADHVAVRVLRDDSAETSADNLTKTFVLAVELAVALQDSPVLDESDWSELQTERQEEMWNAYLRDQVLTEICEFFQVDEVSELTLNTPEATFDGWNTIGELFADSNAEAVHAAYYQHESTEWVEEGTSFHNGHDTEVMRDLIGNLFVPRAEQIDRVHGDAIREDTTRADGPNQLTLI
jgi:hypothetical protein